ncbi:MAG: hypothetical protein ACTSV7_12875 [Candidatus Baldrarchaeia archaeon]
MGAGIGTLIGLLLFVALGFVGQMVPALGAWSFVISTFVAGLVAKRAKSGAIAGFLTAFIPLLAVGVLLILSSMGITLAPVTESGIIVYVVTGVVQSLAAALAIVVTLILGIVLIVAGAAVGIIGAIIGAIGGFIASKM